MKNPAEPHRDGGKIVCADKKDREQALIQIRQQSRWAVVLLFFPWFLTIFFCWPEVWGRPAAIMGLLPGLAAAIHITSALFLHLPSNHCYGAEECLFPSLGAANWITLVRGSAIVALGGSLPLSLHTDLDLLTMEKLAWVSGFFYLAISLLDLLDGYAARRQRRETALGKQLDIVTDAAGLLVASLVAVALGQLPFVYLLVGLAYYPFVFGIWLRRKRGLSVATLRSRPGARIIAGYQMGLVAIALFPIFTPKFSRLAAYIFMIPLLIGFFRDWLVVSCRIQTNSKQQTKLDLWIRSFIIKPLPLMLRLVIFSCGIATLASTGVIQTHPVWQITQSFCCLLAALGFMGRSASLLQVLLLGSSQSPFGLTTLSTILFAAFAALSLSGSGTLSLWAPEESILFRRSRQRADTPSRAS